MNQQSIQHHTIKLEGTYTFAHWQALEKAAYIKERADQLRKPGQLRLIPARLDRVLYLPRWCKLLVASTACGVAGYNLISGHNAIDHIVYLIIFLFLGHFGILILENFYQELPFIKKASFHKAGHTDSQLTICIDNQNLTHQQNSITTIIPLEHFT